jgi:transcriptional regulator with XRE-family HTH domain
VARKENVTNRNRIKQLRLEQHKTQKEVGEAVGLSDRAIAHYEKGIREPKLETWIKLADFFEVPVSYLQGTIDDRKNFPHDEELRDDYYNAKKFVDFIQKINKDNIKALGTEEENFNINDYDNETKKVAGKFINDVESLTEFIIGLDLVGKKAKSSRVKLFKAMDNIIHTIHAEIGEELFNHAKTTKEFSSILEDKYSNMAVMIYVMLGLSKNKQFNNIMQNALEEYSSEIDENTKIKLNDDD